MSPTAEWLDFSFRFCQAHPGFCERIAKKYPGITRMEMQVCMAARSLLSNKETQQILGISQRALWSHHHWLRELDPTLTGVKLEVWAQAI